MVGVVRRFVESRVEIRGVDGEKDLPFLFFVLLFLLDRLIEAGKEVDCRFSIDRGDRIGVVVALL